LQPVIINLQENECMENCTIYSHEVNMGKVSAVLQAHFDKSAIKMNGEEDHWESIVVTTGKKLWKSGQTLTIRFRQRSVPGYQLPPAGEPVADNLRGMYNFVAGITAANIRVQELLLAKIATINTELTFIADPAFTPQHAAVIMQLAKEMDGFLFSGNNGVFTTTNQGFWDAEGALLLDTTGASTATDLTVNIAAAYFDDAAATTPAPDAIARKDRSDAQLRSMEVKINRFLPVIEAEAITTIRSAREIAERLVVLAAVNSVAFNHFSGADIATYLQKNQLWELTTPKEKAFLNDPKEEDRTRESWKCEDIWVLLWALKKLPALGSMDALANLEMISPADYPFHGLDGNPAAYIAAATERRMHAEILDANDLYYRADWACVDARINRTTIEVLHPGIVYERHYALNWLINYCDQLWDDVSCDT
jgi:hypothetical protein